MRKAAASLFLSLAGVTAVNDATEENLRSMSR
jgi:hypothetical protein